MRTNSYNNMIRDFVGMANAMNRMADREGYDYARNGGSDFGNGESSRIMQLPINVWSDEDNFFINAYLPGVQPENVDITMEGDELRVSGEFAQPQGEVNFIKQELYHGKFQRELTFNTPVNVDEISAKFENGQLMLTVPKAETVKPRRIEVQVA